MKRTGTTRAAHAGGAVALLALALGCGGQASIGMKAAPGGAAVKRNPDGTVNDKSRCEWRGRADREASETAGPGSYQPNVRRVYQVLGTGDDRHKVLVCREIDTNFDGVKDVVRRYNDKGESLYEETDANYDGRVDTWITFAKGHLAEVKIDTNHDGNADEWKYYSGGRLARVKRDTNRDGKPDIWEIYHAGRLERMGVDIDGDERVDRWDHDTEARRKIDEAERRKEEEAAAKKKAADTAADLAADKANEAAGDAPAQPAAAEDPGLSKRKKK